MEPNKILEFAVGEIPNGLKKDHRISVGLRGVLRVREGSLIFVDADGRKTLLQMGEYVELGPQVTHHIEEAETAAIVLELFST